MAAQRFTSTGSIDTQKRILAIARDIAHIALAMTKGPLTALDVEDSLEDLQNAVEALDEVSLGTDWS